MWLLLILILGNHFSALKQSGRCADKYTRAMKILGKYHARNIHHWINDDGDEEECGFHPLVVCSCAKCKDCVVNVVAQSNGKYGNEPTGSVLSESDGDDGDAGSDSDDGDDSDGSSDKNSKTEDSSDEEVAELSCDGKPYVTGNHLSCPHHAALYEIKCNCVAAKAKELVDSDMGNCHSNLPESKFNVLTRFQSKSVTPISFTMSF